MEVIKRGLIDNGAEVLPSPDGTVGTFPSDICEVRVVLIGRVDEGVAEGILRKVGEVERVAAVGNGAVDFVIARASDDTVGKASAQHGIEDEFVVDVADT